MPLIIQRLVLLLSDVTGTPAESLHAGSSPENTAGWDSFANLALISAIDEEFNVSIPAEQVAALRTLGAFAEYLTKTGIAAAES